jgi:hypothetical protein
MRYHVITRKDWLRLRTEAAARANRPIQEPYRGCRPYPADRPLPHAVIPWPSNWPTIPREDWPNLIRQQRGTFLTAHRAEKLRPHNQGSTNRCWAHGCVRALEILRVWQGQPPLLLSPDSIAYPIEGTHDNGGYAAQAAQQLATGGACAQTLWPEADLSPRRADKSWQNNALSHVLLLWIKPQTYEQQITCALRRIPVAIELDWWGHLVCQLDPVLIGDKEVGAGIDNSWGDDWGIHGYDVLDEESATASGCYAPLSETFSRD